MEVVYNSLNYHTLMEQYVYIIYELHATDSHIDDPMLKNSLFGAITLTKNADIDKYGYSGYGIGFDRKSSFTFQELMKQDT